MITGSQAECGICFLDTSNGRARSLQRHISTQGLRSTAYTNRQSVRTLYIIFYTEKRIDPSYQRAYCLYLNFPPPFPPSSPSLYHLNISPGHKLDFQKRRTSTVSLYWSSSLQNRMLRLNLKRFLYHTCQSACVSPLWEVRSGVNAVVWVNEAFGRWNDLQEIRTRLLHHEWCNSPMRYSLRHSAALTTVS